MTTRLLLAWLRGVATVMRVPTRYPSVRPRNWRGRGVIGPPTPVIGTARVQKTYQHSGRAALMAGWPSVVISEANDRAVFVRRSPTPGANNNN